MCKVFAGHIVLDLGREGHVLGLPTTMGSFYDACAHQDRSFPLVVSRLEMTWGFGSGLTVWARRFEIKCGLKGSSYIGVS